MSIAASGAVADRLRGLRLAHKLTQGEFGLSIGVSARTIRALESGRYTPSISLACRVARALGQPVETVFTP